MTIRALWVPPATGVRLATARTSSLVSPIAELAEAISVATLVIDHPNSGGRNDRQFGSLVAAVRQQVPANVRMAIALRPASLVGTREHLNALSALRRQCEEWDLDLALDLDGPIDHTWESEAALTKVLPRLSVVRLGPIRSRPPGCGRDRQTARVIAHLADSGYSGVIAISATLPFWRPDGRAALGRAFAETRGKIFSRYGSIPSEMPTDRAIWSREHR